MQTQVANWRALLTDSVEDGRTLLREVLSSPLVFTPEADGYRFRASVATGELIAGAVSAEMGAGAHKVASRMTPLWNRLVGWVREIETLRESLSWAA